MARPAIISGAEVGPQVSQVAEPTLHLSDRTDFRFVVELEGQDLGRQGYTQFLESLVVDDTDDAVPVARLRFYNHDGRFNDDPMMSHGTSVLLSTGWADTSLVSRGRFIVQKSEFVFGGGVDLVELLAYGEGIRLAKAGEKRREWIGVRDSDVVQSVAAEYGWDADVDVTTEKHERILQVNESDGDFLRRLAVRCGHQLFVRDGVLHFHEVRYDLYKAIPAIQYRGTSGRATITNLRVGVEGALYTRDVRATQVDPLSRQQIDVQSSARPDAVSRYIDSRDTKVRDWSKLAADKSGNVPVAYLLGTTHEQNQAQLQKQADGMGQATRFLVQGTGESVGAEMVNAGSLISVVGIGRFSGLYYVKRAIHRLGPGGYSVEIDICRSSLKDAGEVSLQGKLFGEARDGGSSERRFDVSGSMPVAGTGTILPGGEIQIGQRVE